MKDVRRKAWKCGAGAKTSCKCHGTLWYGPTVRPDNQKPITTWEDLRLWKTLEKQSGDWITCSDDDFGGDPWPEQEKQCWCEDKPAYRPYRCGDDGDDCLCEGGFVVYGAKHDKDKKELSFFDLVKGTVALESVGGKTRISCSAASFGGADPAPDGEKTCFCDAEKKFFDAGFIAATKAFWKAQIAQSSSEAELTSTALHVTEVQKAVSERTEEGKASASAGEAESAKALAAVSNGQKCKIT